MNWGKDDRVEITAGEFAGRVGTVTYRTGGRVAVLLDGEGRSRYFWPEELRTPSQPPLF